jgi:hypothetical protein
MASTINSDNGVVSGSAGLKYSSDSTGVLALQTNGNTAVTIDSTGRMGIGTTSPAAPLHILQTGSNSTYVNIETQGSVNQSWKLLNAGGSGTFYLQDATASVNRFAFGTNGNLTFNTDGAGVVFSNSSALTNSTLKDYEVGTWTPAIGGSSSNPTVSYNFRLGTYVKVGQMVMLSCRLRTMSVSGGSGDLWITGLPFIPNSTSYYNSVSAMYMFNTATSKYGMYSRLDTATNYIGIYYDAYNVSSSTITIADLGTGSYSNELSFTLCYLSNF